MVAETLSSVEEGAGFPVVLIHGFGCSSAQWMYTVPALAAAGLRAIAVDLPGFGASYLPATTITTASYAGDILRFLDHLRIPRAVLIGSSMGGFVSWRVASQAPDRVAALVLSDAAGAPPPGHAQREASQPVGAAQRGAPPAVAGQHGVSQPAGAAQREVPQPGVEAPARKAVRAVSPVLRKSSRAGSLRPLVATLMRPLTGLLASRFIRLSFGDPSRLTPDVERALRHAAKQARIVQRGRLAWAPPEEDAGIALERIRCPALVAWGDKDRIIPIASMQFFTDHLLRAESVVFQGVGHIPMLEAPQEFNSSVLNFLRKSQSI